MEEKLEELREKYSQALAEGNTDKATEYYWKVQELKGEAESSGASSFDFEKLDGVGPELAEELAERFEDGEDLAEASKEDLEPVPGIGEKKAESLLEQVR